MANLRVTQLENRYTVYRIPTMFWGVLALLTLLSIPQHQRRFPNESIAELLRAEHPWQIASCFASALFLTFYVWCGTTVAEPESLDNVGPQTDSPRQRLQFGIGDMLVLTTAAGLCLSLWKLSDEWFLAAMLATFMYQAYILRRVPERRKFIVAWLIVWTIVAMMVLTFPQI